MFHHPLISWNEAVWLEEVFHNNGDFRFTWSKYKQKKTFINKAPLQSSFQQNLPNTPDLQNLGLVPSLQLTPIYYTSHLPFNNGSVFSRLVAFIFGCC